MPCGKDARGKDTVYSQHQTYFREKGTPREPRQAMVQDFKSALARWLEAGEKVVVFMDANKDI